MKDKFDYISIPIPENLNEVIESSMSEVKKIHKRRMIKKIGGLGTAAAVIILMAICISNPTLASKLPVVGKIFAEVEKKVEFPGDYSTKALNACYTAKNNGLEITTSEIFCDGSSVYISFLLKNDNSFREIASLYSNSEGTMTHHFLYTSGIWGIGQNGQRKQLMNNHIEGIQVDNNTFKGMMKLELGEFQDKLPNSSDLYISFNQIWADQSDGFSILKIDGNWEFMLPYEVDRENTRIIEVNDKNASGYGIESIMVTPYEVKVTSIVPLRKRSEEELQAYLKKFKKASKKLEAVGKEPIDIDQQMDTIPKSTFVEYGVSIFDQNGDRLQFEEQNGPTEIFAVKGKKLTRLFVYIGTDAIDTLKETDQRKMEEKAVYKKEINLE